MKKIICLLVIVMIGVVLAESAYSQMASPSAATAQDNIPEIRAVGIVAPPFVMQQNGSLTGFSFDLWNAIAARLKLKTSYQIAPDAGALEEAMRSKRADVTVTPVFITSARDDQFDFSYPVMEAGLQIMVRESGETAQTSSPLWDLLRLLFSRTTAIWLGVAILLVIIPAHLIWFLDRRQPDSMLSNRSYIPGIFEVLYWGISSLTSQAQTMPHQWLARVISNFWMFVGVVFVALYTAQLTASLTMQQIRGAIEGPGDLPGKQVATIAGTTAVAYLQEQNAQVREFPTTDLMFKALLDKKVDAIVSVAPLLLYYAAHEGKGRVKVVGPEINSAPVSLMFQLDSPLRKRVDRTLIALRENGTYQQLYNKWFGTP
ncbi:MAG TPA: transporter substrate-binding domain-containing protein [Candidatus Binataceae bacterium]|nr:transporter substrate-binding domain-containing protein [Candidatus Binataceae bacterium]